ncbi:Rab5 GDP/GTP exchange factor [Aphelenchoides avenae]|nr:Rab5 GDP/GTP exchange factor [Aphelenchus avenae]
MEEQMSDDRRLRVQITEQELLCKNRCGFYGTPQWNGLCSQCWRAFQLEQKKVVDYKKNRSLLGKNHEEKGLTSASESRSSLKSLLRKSSTHTPASDAQPGVPYSSSSSSLRPLSPDSLSAQDELHAYLYATFTPQVAKEVEKQCWNLVDKLNQSETVALADLSDGVQNFYQALKDRVTKIQPPPVDFDVSEFMNQVEKFVCFRGYNSLFCSRSDEEAADLALQDRIRSLHWVTFGFLETSLDSSSSTVQDSMDEALTEIVDMNSHRSVARKLECLIKCSTRIFEALKESRSGAPASADEFLPVLIYVILKANPPLVQSNLNFISRFALPSRVLRGESGYYFTNLSCALNFIQNMNAESLKMKEEEFEAYTSGRQVAPMRQSTSSSSVNSIKNSLKRLEELAEARQRMHQRLDELSLTIDE